MEVIQKIRARFRRIQFLLDRVNLAQPDECWLWHGPLDPAGYGIWTHLGKITKAHRASWSIWAGAKIPPGLNCLHHCDVRNCINPHHLYIGTQADNVRDMINRGRFHQNRGASGEANHRSKLTNEDVIRARAIREELGLSYKKIAPMFGCSTMAIFRAITRQSWSHIE